MKIYKLLFSLVTMSLGKNINVEQDEDLLENALENIKKLFTKGEKHMCSAIQKKPIANILPHMLIVTNKRVIKHEPKILKSVFDDYLWMNLLDAHLSDHIFGSRLIFEFENGNIIINHLPKNQAKKIYCIAQEKEEEWIEKKRLRGMEEEKAKSGASHIVVGNHPSNEESNDNSKLNLKKKLLELKELLDEELITQDEYQNKKSQILKGI